MKTLMKATLALFALASAAVSQTGAPAVWTPEMQIKTRAVAAPRVSPDGKRIVYTVSDAVLTADRSEYVSQVWIATTDGRENLQLTFADKSSTNPKWSPDGNWIAFTSTRKDNKNNLYLLRASGGEAEALTDLKSGISDFDWSPDGRWIAYASADAKTEDEEKNDKAKNDFRWVDENVKMSRLYVIPVERDAAGKREPRRLTSENYNVAEFDWSPDGRAIAFSHSKTPVANDWTTSDVSIVDVASGRVTAFANTAAAENSPLFSPDGKSIALLVSDVPPRWAQSGTVQIFPASGGQPKILSASYDVQPNVAGWSADGQRLYFSEAKGTGTQIYAIDVSANRIEEIKSSPAVYSAVTLNRGGTAFGLVRQTAAEPQEAYVATVRDFSPVQVSRANAGVKMPPLGKTEVIRWKSTDGREIEGLLTYPAGYQAGKRVPLILNIHGGPAGVFQQTFIGGRGVYPLASFASRGYAILRPNPRGSSGYGLEFRRANIKDWGGADFQDLMTGVDSSSSSCCWRVMSSSRVRW